MNFIKTHSKSLVIVLVMLLAIGGVALYVSNLSPREFSMHGSSINDLDSGYILAHILKAEELPEDAKVFADTANFTIILDGDFNFKEPAAVRYNFTRDEKTMGAQIRMYTADKKYMLTESTEWNEKIQGVQLKDYLDAIRYIPTEKAKELFPDAEEYLVDLTKNGVPDDFEHSVTYTAEGVKDTEDFKIHLSLKPYYNSTEGETFGTVNTGESLELFFD